ncbi:uncharacterized protein B0H18DRAFT_1212005 [Fomitopsis serialis]|uniref:uncharacterized protein n=1 Tax=Fomitopsis serialis TaxID=139415 RepID=UPI0020077132|nr:uncharacterized protein B0H18DRAFT_1212005 [Neoantrodia serialis]KAH9924050.1 hypothetical protein B0H18DRAFT_1212005 [Neoantrodia serialis]
MEDMIMTAPDHPSTRFSPPVDDMAPTQIAQWRADGQTCDDESGPDRRSGSDSSSSSRRPASVQSSLLLSSADRFPFEVFEDIIDEMDDASTLLAAAQVRKAWYPRAIRNLYYTVKIDTRKRFDMLFKLCRASPHVKQWLATTRELRLADDDRWDDFIVMDLGGGKPRFLHAVPPALGHAMSRVQHLAFKGLRGDVHATFYLALSQFSSVKSLELSWCSLKLSQLRRIIYTFPLLTTLTLKKIRIVPHETVSPMVTTSFRSPHDIHLRYLCIKERSQNSKLIDWIAQSGLCISLEDLTVWVNEESLWESVSALLKTAGSSLTRLETDYLHGDLEHNTALRSLVLRLARYSAQLVVTEDQGHNINRLASQLHGLLSTVRSHQLEHLEIETFVWTSYLAASPARVDLRALHKTMSQPHFNALKDVKVKVDMGRVMGMMTQAEAETFSQELEAMFQRLLRPWSDRGTIKRFTWVHPMYYKT